MTYQELYDAISLYAEDFEDGFLASIPGFLRAAEQRVYNVANIPATNRSFSVSLDVGQRTLTLPSELITINELVLVTNDTYTTLLPKEPSFLQEAYPSLSELGVPKYYAQLTDATLAVAPASDGLYSGELTFFGYPESVVDAGTTWLSNNFDQVLLYGALVEAGVFMKSGELMMKAYTAQFDSALALLVEFVGKRSVTDNYRSGRR